MSNWTYSTTIIGEIDDLSGASVNLRQNETRMYRIQFSRSGTAHFRITSGDVNVSIYLTTDTAFNLETGEPDGNILNDDTGGRPSIGYTVNSTDDYFFWIKPEEPGAVGDLGWVQYSIEAPDSGPDPGQTWNIDSEAGSHIYDGDSRTFDDGYPGAYTVSRMYVTFDEAGTYRISGNSSYSYYGWLTTATGFNASSGIPTTEIVGSDTDGAGGLDFTVYNIDTSTDYWFWIRTADGAANPDDIVVTFDLVSSPPSSDWSYDNTQGDMWNVGTGATVSGYTASPKAGVLIGVSFLNSGTYRFSSVNSGTDLYAYLSEGYPPPSYDTYAGIPLDFSASDTTPDAGGNFQITFTVTAGDIYYLWVRGADASDSGTFDIRIEIPPVWWYSTETAQTGAASYSIPLALTSGVGFRIPITFSVSGTATFRTTQSSASPITTVGYLGTSGSDAYDSYTGEPRYYDESGEGIPGGENFRIAETVTAGVTYYLWVRGKTGGDIGSVTVEASVATDTGGGKCWIYISSEGDWVQATPYIYISGSGWVQATPYIYANGGWHQTI